jgi:ABC-type branched-subunit amino acid transport system ATPase component
MLNKRGFLEMVPVRQAPFAAAGEIAPLYTLSGPRGNGEWQTQCLRLGQRKRLEVGRAIVLDPKLLLLDELLAGLSSAEVATMADADSSRPGITVVLVEHNLGEVLRVADRLVMLDAGKVLAEGAPNDVMARADVRQAYTGVV